LVNKAQEMNEFIGLEVRLGHIVKTVNRHSKIVIDNSLHNLGWLTSLHRHLPQAPGWSLGLGVIEVFTVSGFHAGKAAILGYLDGISTARGHFPELICPGAARRKIDPTTVSRPDWKKIVVWADFRHVSATHQHLGIWSRGRFFRADDPAEGST
jgi:hypothetical protein